MKGIVHLNSYLPKYRIQTNVMNEAWGLKGGKNAVAVANFDEDTITMAVEAASNHFFNQKINTCLLATTSSPFTEESASAIVSYTLGLKEDCRTIDVNQAINGGLKSLCLLNEMVNDEGNALLITSDNRSASIGSPLEKEMGDAACAIEFGTEGVIAEIVDAASYFDFGYHSWQRANDQSVFTPDEKFSNEVRINQYVKAAENLLTKAGLTINDIAHLIVADRQENMTKKVAQTLGKLELAQESKVYKTVGFAGVSMPFLLLNETLHKAKSGEFVLCMQTGSGVDAALLKITSEIETYKRNNNFIKQLESGVEIDHYQKFLQKRNVIERSHLLPYSTLTYLRRERETNLQLMAQVCEQCGTIHFPKQVLCSECKTKLGEKKVALEKKGKIFTFTQDYVFPGKDLCVTMAVIDLENGGRIFTQMTDLDEEVKVGDQVNLVYRKVHDGANYPNYFWKAASCS